MASAGTPLRLGTRGSQLARWQANWVASELRSRGRTVELVEITTRGDETSAGPIGQIGTEGVFTKQIQQALLAGDVDLAVHSLKDLPTEKVDGLVLAAVPPRANPHDVLVSSHAASVDDLPQGARIGTGSVRRQAQLLYRRPDLRVADIRGNVDTRLGKLDEENYDAIILAAAGLERLELTQRIRQVLPFDVMLPAVGQGALGIECRADDAETLSALATIDHQPTHQAVLAERSLLAALRGGCQAPVGAHATWETADALTLAAVVLSADGTRRLEHRETTSAADVASIGHRVAEHLRRDGAERLIAAARTR